MTKKPNAYYVTLMRKMVADIARERGGGVVDLPAAEGAFRQALLVSIIDLMQRILKTGALEEFGEDPAMLERTLHKCEELLFLETVARAPSPKSAPHSHRASGG
jgi:hypothetical protein